MGISPFKTSVSMYDDNDKCMSPAGIRINEYDTPPDCSTCKAIFNPDPNNYVLIRHIAKRGHLLIELRYPDCTNYEGKKILLYTDTRIEDLVNQKTIDPHFSKNEDFKSPVARFEPTPKGWEMGMRILNSGVA